MNAEIQLKRVTTSQLEIAYLESGAEAGLPVVLVHGWPDDAMTWSRIVPDLTQHGFRTIAPYLRGFGPTRFLPSPLAKSAQLTALGQDLIEFTEQLGLERFLLVGHDWGARASYILSALKPERVRALVALSVGYGTNNPDQAISYPQARLYWYHWFFATERGRRTLTADRRGLCRFLWETWSPAWRFSESEFEETARSWDNPDWVDVTLHSYQHRWGHAEGDTRYAELERAMAVVPPITVPAIVIHGSEDGATLPETSAGKERFFTAGYERRLVRAGHFVQREDPASVLAAVLELAQI